MGCLPSIHETLGEGEEEEKQKEEYFCKSGVIVYTCNPSTGEDKADGFL